MLLGRFGLKQAIYEHQTLYRFVFINRRKWQILVPKPNFYYNKKKRINSFTYKAGDDPLDPEQQAQGGGHWQQHFQQHFQGHGFNPFGN